MSRYKIEVAPVGQGGFGKVHPGHDSILDRRVAVKSLHLGASASAEDKERFRREAKTLATLSHPNIPAIYDVNFSDDKLEIIFQFVEGETMRSILDLGEPIPLSQCKRWFDQLASALDHAHEKDIIHRDIKPENIIISPDRKHCYLVDFGIALSGDEMERLTGSDNWIGTPGYMSPEQEHGDDLDPSDDLYVLGGCLYEALCGHRIEQGDYKALSSINELVPPSIDTLIKRCISQKPRRLSSASEFRNLLAAALQGHRTFSEILSNGQLHEVIGAIGQMSAAQFMELKVGQRLLVLQKCADVVAAPEKRFAAARSEFLAAMTCIGVLLDAQEYKKIIQPAISLGFAAVTEDDPFATGVPLIRDAMVDASRDVTQPNHHVIVEALTSWVSNIDIEKQKVGLFHSLRLVVHALMANPECSDEDAVELANLLSLINDLQRTRAAESDQEPRTSIETSELVSADSDSGSHISGAADF